MAGLSKRLGAVVLSLALFALAASSASAAPAINGIFKVPGVETNKKIVAGPDGNMWVTVSDGANNVARISPTGQATPFELEGVEGAVGITVGLGGTMWVTTNNGVAKFSTTEPKKTTVATEIAGVTGFNAIVTGPDGNLWVAASEKVVHFPPNNPAGFTPIAIPKLAPRDIDVAGSLIVVADQGEESRVITLTTAGVEKDFKIGGGGQGVAGNAAGQIAFSAAEAKPEQAGLITPPNPAQSFELLGDPFGVALGSDQAFWVVQFAAGALARVTSTGQLSFLPGLPKESARQIAPGPNNTLWVTLEKKEGVIEDPSVARITGLEPPVTNPPPLPLVTALPTKPQTRLGKGTKSKFTTTGKLAQVKFQFTSSVAGSKFECALQKIRKGKKAAKPRFSSCKSPRTYRLKPGLYRFKVRAVADGLTDETPASRAFSVIHVDKR